MENSFKRYYRKGFSELRPYINGEKLVNISISKEDLNNGSPKKGDMIARNPDNHDDQWLISEKYFGKNFTTDVILPIGFSVKLINGRDKGKIKNITDHIKFENQQGYRLNNEADAIYLMEDFE